MRHFPNSLHESFEGYPTSASDIVVVTYLVISNMVKFIKSVAKHPSERFNSLGP